MIQPRVLIDKFIKYLKLDFNPLGWVLHFFTNRAQSKSKWMHIRGVVTIQWISSVLCPFTPPKYSVQKCLVRADLRNALFKNLADDSVLVSLLLSDEKSHGPVVNKCVDWGDSACHQDKGHVH